ncbi:MAG: XdhC/CoxI family protein [Candidatus Cloacimonetes bacterium]|nr:XdhC/CoxI family protein [Candidatus Cloacimonadota bacterium]
MEIPVQKILERAVEINNRNIPFVLATVVQGAKGSPCRAGFKLICYADGRFEGTVGGGEIERIIIEKSIEIFVSKKSQLFHYELTESEKGIGMQCGGTTSVFLEYIQSLRRVFLFGAGHLCRSIVPILKTIGFHINVIDNREEYANRDKIPDADNIYALEYENFLKDFSPSSNDAIVIFTHGHKHDFVILDTICKKNPNVKYIGMIGSKIKVKIAVDKIKLKTYEGNLIDRIYAPIGLNVAKTTTQEISISIVAELLAIYNNIEKVDFMSHINKKRDVF